MVAYSSYKVDKNRLFWALATHLRRMPDGERGGMGLVAANVQLSGRFCLTERVS